MLHRSMLNVLHRACVTVGHHTLCAIYVTQARMIASNTTCVIHCVTELHPTQAPLPMFGRVTQDPISLTIYSYLQSRIGPQHVNI